MKRPLTAIALMSAAIASQAQTDYSMLRAVHPDDFRLYDTNSKPVLTS